MTNIIAVTPTNVYDLSKMKYLLYSTKKNNFKVDVIGLGKEFRWIERMKWFQTYLNEMPKDTNDIICFTDAYDVFYVDGLDTIKEKFLTFQTDIVWSVEKSYSHQINKDKGFFDDLCKTNHGYKYLNGGTFVGYKNALLQLFNDVLDISLNDKKFIREINTSNIWRHDNDKVNGLDQTWISHHIRTNFSKYKIRFDYLCEIFYVAVGDWDNIKAFVNNDMVVLSTGKSPSIIHVPWKAQKEPVLKELFEMKYGTGVVGPD